MREFVEEDDIISEKNNCKRKYDFFRRELKEMATYKNQEYWVYRTIILRNLFGVDFMYEAAEVAKLRLFLKLAAAAEMDDTQDNMGLEPLPDIDFNIRAGNSLVGFVSMEDFTEQSAKFVLWKKDVNRIKLQAASVGGAYRHFVNVQTGVISDIGSQELKDAKTKLQNELKTLNEQLDQYLANIYGVSQEVGGSPSKKFIKWQQSHKPFHWATEFYEIMEDNEYKKGGFDVVIGNPPYVGYDKNFQEKYTVREYKTESCNDLYAFFVERVKSLIYKLSPMGMIIPCPAFSTDNMVPMVEELKNMNNDIYVSFYAMRPSKLFLDAEQSLAIYLSVPAKQGNIKTTNYMKWNSKYRKCLFNTIEYSPTFDIKNIGTVPKIKADIELSILKKILAEKTLSSFWVKRPNKHAVYYHNTARYWTRAHDYIPYFRNERDGEKPSKQIKSLYIRSDCVASLCSLINSSLFYWWYVVMSDCRHLNSREINNFPINLEGFHKEYSTELASLVERLMTNYRDNSIRKNTVYKATGQVIYDEFHPKHGKLIMDEIDKVLAKHYNFSEEELDYIINYDYKYRMGGAE